ncbi:MAG: DUF4347 domain-containing protein [Planctomycetaceae bacterium]
MSIRSLIRQTQLLLEQGLYASRCAMVDKSAPRASGSPRTRRTHPAQRISGGRCCSSGRCKRCRFTAGTHRRTRFRSVGVLRNFWTSWPTWPCRLKPRRRTAPTHPRLPLTSEPNPSTLGTRLHRRLRRWNRRPACRSPRRSRCRRHTQTGSRRPGFLTGRYRSNHVAALLNHTDVTGIHIVSHGTEGHVRLGSTTLSLENVDTYRNAISAWQYSMSDTADILIYGCNVAASEDGRQLLNQLSVLTDSDVAASDDLTGHESQGGDWDLEYSVGLVTTQSVFSSDFEDEWQWVLNTYTVTTTVDENNGTGALSLREAIIAANASPGADTIELGVGTYVLSRIGDGENAASLGDLDISGQITITGQGVTNTIIDASAMSDRIFELTGTGNLTLSGMKIIGGAGDTYAGGAVDNNGGSLTVTDVVFDGNNVGNADGGTIYSTGTTVLNRVTILNSSAINGGAINVSGGTATLTNVTISSSTATFDGAAVRVNAGSATINFSTIAGNTATSGHGGGVYASGAGTITINSSVLADNTAAFCRLRC